MYSILVEPQNRMLTRKNLITIVFDPGNGEDPLIVHDFDHVELVQGLHRQKATKDGYKYRIPEEWNNCVTIYVWKRNFREKIATFIL
jgi:hypothetical protein